MMPDEHRLIAGLTPHDRPLSPDDTMAEAGRIVLLRDFMTMLNHEAGALTGEDIEDVHEMRVATRRMRSALRLLEPYYTGRTARKFRDQLGGIADVLGDIRDRDVLLADMTAHLPSLAEPLQIELRRVMQWLEGERETERAELQSLVTKRRYTRFVDDLNAFLTTPGARTVEPAADQVMPTLVRHVLPTVIYEHLGVVRAYERVVESADAPMLHQLRIEFKRLRYAIAFFEELLGSSVRAYLKELKAMQDHLGRMQDVATAHLLLEPMKPRLDQAQTEALDAYLAAIEAERADLRGQVADKWAKFDSALVQKKLTSAIAAF